MRRLAMPALAAGFAILFYVKTKDLSPEITTYPHLFVMVILALAVIVVVQEAIRARSAAVEDREGASGSPPEPGSTNYVPELGLLLGSLLYLLAFPSVGFVTSSALFLFVLILLLGWGIRGITLGVLTRVAAVCVVVLGAFYGLFRQWMQIPLP